MEPVYITKYALTSGIIKITPQRINPNGSVTVKMTGAPFDQYFGSQDYALNEPGARAWAEAIRVKRIAALKKQISRLEKLEIKIVEQ